MSDKKQTEKTEKSEKSESQPELTYGQQVVGVAFNPSKIEQVDRLKEIFAEAVDIVNGLAVRGDVNLHANLKTWSVNQTLQAQMAAVKALTYGLEKK